VVVEFKPKNEELKNARRETRRTIRNKKTENLKNKI